MHSLSRMIIYIVYFHEHCRDAAFRWCVDVCASGAGCVMLPPEMEHPHTGCVAACPGQIDVRPPAAVRAFRWSCRDDCQCVP